MTKKVSLPVIFVGDLNSDADSGDQTYSNLVAAGVVDAWSTTNPGYTCCLVNGNTSSASTLTIRIDLVLLLNKARALDMEIVGNEPADLTPSGLWPSDHAGVVATVRI